MGYGNQLRSLIEQDGITVLVGCHDPLTARAIEEVGFDAIYMSGYGTSVSKTGYPDAGLITMPEIVENGRNVQEAVDVPVIADADNGYGNATNVVRTVREYIKAGVGGIHIEDQTSPKRCGHVSGRQVIGREEAVGKIRAAADVRDERDERFVLMARTDARGAVGGSLREAIARVNAFCDAGADLAFVEGLVDEEEIERTGREVDAPLVYNCTGVSPRLEPEELEEYGFDFTVYPGLSTRATIENVYRFASRVRDAGTAGYGELEERFEGLPFGFHEFSGFPDVVEWEERYMPEEESEKYEKTLGADITDGRE